MIVLSQGTTPYLSLLIRGFDLSAADSIVFTVRYKSGMLTLDNERIEVVVDSGDSTLTIHLTQEETLGIPPGISQIQLRWKDSDGEAYATRTQPVNLLEVLYKEVI